MNDYIVLIDEVGKPYLSHYGIKGQKWGIRRYQNFDGSYTREGLKRYRASLDKYNAEKKSHDKIKKQYKETKKYGYSESDGKRVTVSKDEFLDSKRKYEDAKYKVNRDYKQLKKDKKADIGKKLYNNGRTITSNYYKEAAVNLVPAGLGAAAKYMYDNGDIKSAKQLAIATIGASVVAGLECANIEIQNSYLRAYYTHSRPRD